VYLFIHVNIGKWHNSVIPKQKIRKLCVYNNFVKEALLRNPWARPHAHLHFIRIIHIKFHLDKLNIVEAI